MRNPSQTFEFWRDRPFRNDFVVWGGIGLLALSWSIWRQPAEPWFQIVAAVSLGLIFTAGKGHTTKINYTSAKFTEIRSFWFIPYGKRTRDVSVFTRLELRLFTENQQMNMKSISQTTRTRVFDVYLANDQGEELKVADSTDYAKAQDYLQVLAHGLSIPTVNTFEEFKARLRQRGQAEKRRRSVTK